MYMLQIKSNLKTLLLRKICSYFNPLSTNGTNIYVSSHIHDGSESHNLWVEIVGKIKIK